MNSNKKKIIVIIIAVIVGILSGFGFYNVNKDKTTEEIVGSAVEELKDYISTYEMSEKEIEELLKLRNPPQPTKSKKCNKCAYYEYCYI